MQQVVALPDYEDGLGLTCGKYDRIPGFVFSSSPLHISIEHSCRLTNVREKIHSASGLFVETDHQALLRLISTPISLRMIQLIHQEAGARKRFTYGSTSQTRSHFPKVGHRNFLSLGGF